MVWIQLAHDNVQHRAFVNTELAVSVNGGEFLDRLNDCQFLK
jgi:hypothetical protein